MSEPPAECSVCRSNAGLRRISPGAVIWEGAAWQVEHAYPSSLLGWLVIVLRRHAEALHDLSEAEATELGSLQRAVARALQHTLGCEKEYAICYGEAPGFAHLHVHVVPRAVDLDDRLKAGGIFVHLRSPQRPVPEAEVTTFCEAMAPILRSLMTLER